jgi:hypothetical protein
MRRPVLSLMLFPTIRGKVTALTLLCFGCSTNITKRYPPLLTPNLFLCNTFFNLKPLKSAQSVNKLGISHSSTLHLRQPMLPIFLCLHRTFGLAAHSMDINIDRRIFDNTQMQHRHEVDVCCRCSTDIANFITSSSTCKIMFLKNWYHGCM